MTSTLAVLGLGATRLPMARHLAATFPVRSYDIDPTRAAAGEFATACSNAREAAAGADIALRPVRNRDQQRWATRIPMIANVGCTATFGATAPPPGPQPRRHDRVTPRCCSHTPAFFRHRGARLSR